MTAPTFPDGPPVPLMVEGQLDGAGLRQLFSDLRAHATGLSVQDKHGRTEMSGAGPVDAATAFDRYLQGAARTLQVRYSYDGKDWVDTIFRQADGFRIVRCQSV